VSLRTISVNPIGFLAIDSEKVGAGVIGPQWIKELFEGGVEAGLNSLSQQQSGGRGNRMVELDYHSLLWLRLRSCGLLVEWWVHPGWWWSEVEGFGARSRAGPSNLRCATGVEPSGSECRSYPSHAILSWPPR